MYTSFFKSVTSNKKITFAILVAALGYFVDVYDLVLFSILRVSSLKDLGLEGQQLVDQGVLLLNSQMLGMLIGGIVFGIYGDKKGRIEVLFGSILLYSLANIGNAFVWTVPQYAVLRFLAGLGLAGEIGAGITLVSELMPKETRGYGTTIVATIGVSGAVAAALVGDLLPWRYAYVVGGVMGLALLVLRISVHESGLFETLKNKSEIARGNLLMLFNKRERFKRYLSCILIGLPTWFFVGIIVTFSPEIAKQLNIAEPITVAKGIFYGYIGLTFGDLVSGLVSQKLKSRKKAVNLFIIATFILMLAILNLNSVSAGLFYTLITAIGFFTGYWAVFITTAAEQFGTNLRATVATSVPNFVRGTTVLMTLLFQFINKKTDIATSALIVCIIVCTIALSAVFFLKETFGKDLDYIEE